jgi:hypothetical protein
MKKTNLSPEFSFQSKGLKKEMPRKCNPVNQGICLSDSSINPAKGISLSRLLKGALAFLLDFSANGVKIFVLSSCSIPLAMQADPLLQREYRYAQYSRWE